MNIGKAIRILRLANGMKLGELANRSDITAGFLSQIESGDKEPSLTVVRALAKELKIPMDLLIEVSKPGEGTLTSTDEKSSRLGALLNKMNDAEEQLKDALRSVPVAK
jgi:transcriptional regulator with XRE-family HTH domain